MHGVGQDVSSMRTIVENIQSLGFKDVVRVFLQAIMGVFRLLPTSKFHIGKHWELGLGKISNRAQKTVFLGMSLRPKT